MALGLNKVMIIGNLGRDPEMRYTPSGKPVTSFSVAVSRTFKKAEGERAEVTDWFNVVVWDRLAEICSQYLSKGSMVYVEGRLETRSWEGDNGQKHFRTEIVASDVNILDRKGRHEETGVMDSAVGEMSAGAMDEPSI